MLRTLKAALVAAAVILGATALAANRSTFHCDRR